MAIIERDVSLLQRRRVAPIYIVYGSAVQIRLNMIDYTIPTNATVEFFAQCGSGPVYRCGGTASGNSASFTPPEGFFRQGDNALQLEINGRMIPLAIDVKCEERISGVGSEDTPEQVRPLVLQAQDAAREANASQLAAAGSASEAAGSADAAGKSAADALQSKNAAAGSADAAAGSAQEAAESKAAAAGSASDALQSKNEAAGSSNEALNSKNAAASSADSAAGSASAAAGSAGAAAGSAQEALERMNAAAGSASAAALSAQAAREAMEKTTEIAVKTPYIGANGNWFVWSSAADGYVDSGINAKGPQGDPGAVQTVCGVAPDASGNVALTAENVGAFPLSGGDMTGPINMTGHPISGLNSPTEESQSANKGYVDTTASKADHRNLLDNSDFRNPVNQRGKTSYSSDEYTIDRWYTGSSMNTVTVNNGYITVTPKSGNWASFKQKLENKVVFGKKLTLAVKVKNGDLMVASGQYPTAAPSSQTTVATVSSGSVYIYIFAQADACLVDIDIGSSINLEWSALYEGEYTAETLPEYRCKGYGAEMAECQRYYQIRSSNNIAAIDMRPTMRLSIPTIYSVSGGYAYSADL